MKKFPLRPDGQTPRAVLALGAHCDDIEIGCGGTMLQLAQPPGTSITWVVFSSTPERGEEARESARRFLGSSERHRVVVKDFRDGFLPYDGGRVKEAFEELKAQASPDLIFTHCRGDLHQDHRLVNELTWNTFRDHPILEYEIPKWDGDLGQPNAYVEIGEEDFGEKARILLEVYGSQGTRPWFSEELFRSLARIRGMECRSATGLAEAFFARKLTLAP